MVERGELRAGVADFLASASFAAITARDTAGRLWVSPLLGPPGFLLPASPTRLLIGATPHAEDPLHGLPADQPGGLIVMDFAARRRLRINGTLSSTGAGMAIDVVQAYGNCPQYIRPRQVRPGPAGTVPRLLRRGDALEPADIAQVQSADTFFLGTSHAVRADANGLRWPDFPGNNMFNSLGNLAVDPAAALLFVDFLSGRTLQLSGAADVQWDDAGERSVELVVRDVVVTALTFL
jgi:predicted pyridoxine 5'-phosphate oxidase superfamily flavin-nucleotide-binding protein